MIDIDVKINPSFYKKVNPSIVKQCESSTIKKTTLEAENRCKKISPGPGNQLPGTDYKASGKKQYGLCSICCTWNIQDACKELSSNCSK